MVEYKSVEILNGRSKIYSWLASFYLSEPNDELLKAASEPKLIEALTLLFQQQRSKEALHILPHLNKGSIEDIKNEFYSLFLIPIRGKYIPMYESCFREKIGDKYGNLWGKVTEEVQKFYRKTGFKAIFPTNVYAPDHIGIELAFMSKMCQEELRYINACNLEEARKMRNAQKAFLKDHLLTWIDDFLKKVINSPIANFYKHIAALTLEFVHLDLKLI